MKLDKESTNCPNSECCQSKDKINSPLKKSFFLEFDICCQLKSIFSRKVMLERLTHRFNCTSSSHSDIYDGSLYKSFSAPGSFLSNVNNISFLWNTDWVSVFKSVKSTLWPMCHTINKLPFKDRVKKENLLVSDIWCGGKQ